MLTKIAQLHVIIFRLALVGILLSTLFLFWNQTTEFFDTPKMIVLVAFVIIMMVVQTLKYITDGKMVLSVSSIDLPVLLLLIVAVVSTYTAEAYYVSLLGLAPRVYGSLVSITTLILLFYLLVNNLRSESDSKPVVYTLLVSSVVLSGLAILSYFGLKFIPLGFTEVANFTPAGSSFSIVALICLVTPFFISFYAMARNKPTQAALLGLMILLSITVVYIGNIPMYIASAASFALAIFFIKIPAKSRLLLVIPVIVALIVGVLSMVSLPGRLSNNVLYQKYQVFPREIQLPISTSWVVSVSAFRDAPFLGTGMGSYLSDFTLYKPVSFNADKYWNLNFDQPFNEYFLLLATLGATGLIAFIVVTFLSITYAIRSIKSHESDIYKDPLAVSVIIIFVLMLFHPSTLVSMVLSLTILGSFFAANQNLVRSIYIKLGTIRSAGDNGFTFDIMPIILIVVMGVLSVVSGYYLVNFTRAAFYHRQATISAANNNIKDAYTQLANSERLNPYNDLYRVDLAQIDFNIANAIALAKGPTESSPAGSLTDDDKNSIRGFLEQSISASRNAVTINPRNANNWIALGSIYRQISGVAQNAIDVALNAYGTAIERDPLNPALRLSVGGVYYSIKSYDMAIRFFTDAINLKADYPNAYYNLSITLRDKGDLSAAQQVAERLVAVLQKDTKSEDYKTASTYLTDLKARIATGSAKEAQTPPATQNTSALQEKKLPKVIDIPKPTNVSTPEAVQK